MAADPSPLTAELGYLDLPELQSRMAAGHLSSGVLVETLVRRIDEVDRPATATALRSVIALSETAIDEAEASDRRRASGAPPGPLEGIPVLVKDNIQVAGLPSTAGSTALLGRPPSADAPLVSRLRQAGAVILGTTNLSQWANIRSHRSSGGWSAVGGLTANPWALDRNAGGSSSGSGAALAAGFAPLAVGTETDGSITCPACLNGVAGIKPSVGSVPSAGLVPISPSQDSAGPMARTVAGVAAMLAVLTGRPLAAPKLPIKVAASTTWLTGHPATDALYESTLDRISDMGFAVSRTATALPTEQALDDELIVLLCEFYDAINEYLPTRGADGPQTLVEVMAHEDAYSTVEQPWFGHELFERAVALGGRSSSEYQQARARNLAWAVDEMLSPILDGTDLLVAPYMAPAWKSDLVLGGHPALSSPVTHAPSVAGWPIASVPMGLADGLPVGLTIIARPGSEATILALGSAVEVPARPSWTPPSPG
jgi:amidase